MYMYSCINVHVHVYSEYMYMYASNNSDFKYHQSKMSEAHSEDIQYKFVDVRKIVVTIIILLL